MTITQITNYKLSEFDDCTACSYELLLRHLFRKSLLV